MKTLLALALLSLPLLLKADGLFDFFGKRDLEVITVTDLTEDGEKIAPPSKANPVYYVAVNVGYKDLGGIIAGDKLPKPQEMNRTIAKVLAKQGFLPATNKHPPTQVVLWLWGSLYVETLPSMNTEMPDRQINRRQMLRFLGGDKLGLVSKERNDPFPDLTEGLGIQMRSAEKDMLVGAAEDDLYVVVLAGYDAKSLAEKKPKRLWISKIAAPSRGFVMAETLPSMVAIAGPNIARSTEVPVWASASDKYRPDVRIGDPKVDAYIDAASGKVLDASKTP